MFRNYIHPFLAVLILISFYSQSSLARSGIYRSHSSGYRYHEKSLNSDIPHDTVIVGNHSLLHNRQEIESSFTVLLNRNEIIPVADLDNGRFACLMIGDSETFTSRINDYQEMPVFRLNLLATDRFRQVLSDLEGYDRIIAGISASALPLDDRNRQVVTELLHLLSEKESIVVFFGPPPFLGQWQGIENVGGLLLAYEDNELVQDLSAQVLFGAIGASGRLDMQAGDLFAQGAGLDTGGGLRLKYTIPEEAGLDSRIVDSRVDSIVDAGLFYGAFPGARVLIAVGGKIILDKAYGHHTYDERIKVEKGDIYDLASVTKITGPLPLYMKLRDEGLLDLDRPLSYYWDDWKSRLFRRSNKEGLILRDLLTHQSGITPYINYWPQTMRNGNYIRRWYRPEQADGYSLEISNHLYLRDNFRKRVYRTIRKSDLLSHGEYRYSCLPFIVSPAVIEEIGGRPYTTALYDDFFKPLGATTLRYNPRTFFPAHRIVPTETDYYFRKEQVHGYVHDEASAVLGGISGNAGLFSTAGDLAKLLQMYLNNGEYGGKRYLSREVIDEFSSIQFPENENRRGLGFDKPLIDNDLLPDSRAYPTTGASSSSFGHSGFTGTFVWMDPEYDLLYIFLSNRVYPTRDNNLISSLNIRTSVLQVIYDELEKSRNSMSYEFPN
ncbi:MAG: serine hydrolase domain-containing protein [Bacteroidales bacterium]